MKTKMSVTQLRDHLKKSTFRIKFVKTDGTVRDMLCTTNPKVVPAIQEPTGYQQPSHLITVWDLENNGWRNIREDSILGAEEQ